ncbi:MAG: ACP S-malonyltransferase [Proteobacteria bacterium]|nr:ACP S-malonyltransferase [Pseudomonadota bacterium]
MTALLFPGQGAQEKGMGTDLFAAFPEETRTADEILGYSIAALCRDDPDGSLRRTQFTQPALYIVGALSYLRWRRDTGRDPAWLAGHSLGELAALFAGGAYDFATGLTLVARRGALMADCGEGSMAAVIGLDEDRVRGVLRDAGLDRLDLANINTPSQIVLAGLPADLAAAETAFTAAGARAYIPLNVSGAFHSRAMEGAGPAFANLLASLEIGDPVVPVLANVTGRPHEPGAVAANLAAQLVSPVRWSESIRWIWGQGEEDFAEMQPGQVLTGLVTKIRAEGEPLADAPYRKPEPVMAVVAPPDEPPTMPEPKHEPVSEPAPRLRAAPTRAKPNGAAGADFDLGQAAFRARFGVAEAIVVGGMGYGVGGSALVEKLARAGFLAFLGADGLPEAEVRAEIGTLRDRLGSAAFGVNVRGGAGRDAAVEARLDLLMTLGVDCVQIGGFYQVERALVRYRLAGVARGSDGAVVAPNRILAKVTRPETAEAFLSPPPPDLVADLLKDGRIDSEAAALAPQLTMADAVVALADCAGDTDGASLLALLPVVRDMRDRLAPHVAVGAGGGIGTAEAASVAFLMGADFVEVGSIMQCTVEAGLSNLAKDILAEMGVQDTELAPSEHWFDWGGKARVLKRGSLFAARANKLYDLYRFYESWDAIPAALRKRIEDGYFQAGYAEILNGLRAQGIVPNGATPKQELMHVFRHYLAEGRRFALVGEAPRRADFQLSASPALGAFNARVRGTALADWRNRHADALATDLVRETKQGMLRAAARATGG